MNPAEIKKSPQTAYLHGLWGLLLSSNTSIFPPRGKLDFPRSLREQRKNIE